MADRYAVVVARVEKVPGTEKLKVVCYPDGAQLFFKSGPTLIRWVFQNVPAEVDKAQIQFFDAQPLGKYSKPTSVNVLRSGALGTSQTKLDSSTSGSHLLDLVTTANSKVEGYFFYKVVLSGQGGLVIESDPGGGNTPENPLPWPPE